jgi:hypothetical protein
MRLTRWEYLTTFLEADTSRSDGREYLQGQEPDQPIARHAPESMIPRLDSLGEKGWELVHMQPVIPGKKGDVLVDEGSGMRRFAHHYFCVFKRPKDDVWS